MLVDLLSNIAVLSRLQARAGSAHFVHAPRISRQTVCLIAAMLSWPLPKSRAFYSSFELKDGLNRVVLAMVLRVDLTQVEVRATISIASANGLPFGPFESKGRAIDAGLQGFSLRPHHPVRHRSNAYDQEGADETREWNASVHRRSFLPMSKKRFHPTARLKNGTFAPLQSPSIA